MLVYRTCDHCNGQAGFLQLISKVGNQDGYNCEDFMAEREGFEPSEHLVGIHAISSRAPSATRASLHYHKE